MLIIVLRNGFSPYSFIQAGCSFLFILPKYHTDPSYHYSHNKPAYLLNNCYVLPLLLFYSNTEPNFEEVDKLRHKVHKLEADNSSWRVSQAEKRRLEEELKDIRKQLETSNHEWAVLRIPRLDICQSKDRWIDRCFDC